MPTLEKLRTPIETLSLRSRDTKYLVDREAAVLRDISLMTGDREATGHGIYIDQKTLETGLAAIAEQGGRLRAAIKHPSFLDYFTGATDRVLDFPGYFSDVEIRGNQLVAGRLDFYDSFKEEHPAEVKRLLEMAEKTPDLFGVSVEIGGYLSFVDEEGNEFSEAPQDVALKYDGLPAFRITDLPYTSFVDQPAANSGLFARFAKLFGGKPDLASLTKIAESFLEWHEKHHADTEPEAKPLKLRRKKPADAFELASAPNGEMTTLSTLRERITDKARLARAFAILADHPEMSAEAIENLINFDDVSAEVARLQAAAKDDAATIEKLRADFATAFAKAAELDGLLASAHTTIGDWQAKFEALKNSGLEEPVNLGAGDRSDGVVNPWLRESLNYTDQSRIFRSDPVLAAALMQEAGVKVSKS